MFLALVIHESSNGGTWVHFDFVNIEIKGFRETISVLLYGLVMPTVLVIPAEMSSTKTKYLEIIKHLGAFAWMGSMLLTLAACSSSRTLSTVKEEGFSFALIGDMPYAERDSVKFGQLVQDINSDQAVEWVLHVGDIKTGNTSCSDAYLEGRFLMFQQFEDPFIFIPGDNEWTDCHRRDAGQFKPLSRLRKLRALFYPEPGLSLGQRTMPLETQASTPGYEEFPEHVRWVRDDIVFVGLHIVGSSNGMAPFTGRTTDDDAESRRRMEAAIQWMREGFEVASALQSPGIFVMIHANPGFPAYQIPGAPAFKSFRDALEQETIRFGQPVLLAHGDSHYFRIDKPLVGTASQRRIENFTRVETFGAGDIHWIRVSVDPSDVNVFSLRQEIVPGNIESHVSPN